MIHASKSCVSHALSPMKTHDPSISNYPIIAIIIVAMLSTSFLLLCYYIFVFKCCFSWNHVDLVRVRDFSLSRQHEETSTTSNSNIASENRGLEESVIQSIPLIHYKKEGNKDSCECVFCLNEFQEDEKLRVIPNCNHVFHIDCVDVWFQNNANCPLCRRQISLTREIQDEQLITPRPSPQDQTQNVENLIDGAENFVVIDLNNEHEGGQNLQEREVSICPGFESNSENAVPLKLLRESFVVHCGLTRHEGLVSAVACRGYPVDTKEKFHKVISLGDECVGNIRDKDDGLLVQHIRRSFSMDLSVHRHQQNVHVNEVSTIEVCGDSRAKRSFFSFGHGSRSRRAVLPIHLDL